MNTPTTPQKRNYSTENPGNRLDSRRIVLPMTYEQYEIAMSTSQAASVSTTADAEGLTVAYGVFKQEAQAIEPQ